MRGTTFSDEAPRGGLMRLLSLSLLLGLLAVQATFAPAWAPSRGYDSLDQAAHRLIAPAAPRAIVDTRDRDAPLLTARDRARDTEGFGGLPLADLPPPRAAFTASGVTADSNSFAAPAYARPAGGAPSGFRARAPPPSL